ncbi:glycosyltransferase family 2 protein [Waterburya agarophytonicola K14]|uniref:Glycosyltransferase family 2 protein n=1 Tax=Waterburya agarophytonicola KI4 TaxID=2874699 RepID=A0A964FKM2_9CYAN|nr:glycosyltransferase family 2 protein [Waterburya agarophytonicola]MCC0179294.1 glycosyltransferase family 2 protein [Waterburya agarophytonicola KI4]
MCQQSSRQFVDTSLDNVLVIIPVRNEEVTIAAVIKSLQEFGLNKIRVVDNASSDRSGIVAEEAGAEVLYEPIPGYGQACWTGLQNIPSEIDWILFCDGDGSDDLNCLPQFLILRSQYDLVLGDRRATPAGKAVMTLIQHFGNGLAGWLIDLGWGYKYQDLGPLRLIRKSALNRIAMEDRGFGWTVEMQVRAIEESLNICEIPVNYRPRQGGRSKISGTISGSFKAGTIILSTLGKLYLKKAKNQERRKEKIVLWVSTLLLLIGAIISMPHGDFRHFENAIEFGYGIAIMCLGFIFSWGIKSLNLWWFWVVAIATRLILLFMYPGDDIWRYIWEGYIQTKGFSPYDFAPNAVELIPYRSSWWSQINHQNVSAIYPPMTQLGFKGLAAISSSVILFKSSFAIADLLICWLLITKFSYLQATFYAWNPLVIYSFAGGGHYDSWFILPLVAAWILLDKQTNKKTSIFTCLLIGISIAVKWISLPILVFLSWINLLKTNFKIAIIVFSVGILPLCLSAYFFCNGDSCSLIPTSSTFVSHGRSAEFLPHLLAKVWYPSTKNNSIFAIPLGLITLFLLFKVRNLQQFILNFLAALLLISPIIHAWYFTWIIPFAVGTKNWGIRLVSLSAFTYFVLPYRQALGNNNWNLTDIETGFLWLPFIFGLAWSWWRSLCDRHKI